MLILYYTWGGTLVTAGAVRLVIDSPNILWQRVSRQQPNFTSSLMVLFLTSLKTPWIQSWEFLYLEIFNFSIFLIHSLLISPFLFHIACIIFKVLESFIRDHIMDYFAENKRFSNNSMVSERNVRLNCRFWGYWMTGQGLYRRDTNWMLSIQISRKLSIRYHIWDQYKNYGVIMLMIKSLSGFKAF